MATNKKSQDGLYWADLVIFVVLIGLTLFFYFTGLKGQSLLTLVGAGLFFPVITVPFTLRVLRYAYVTFSLFN